MASAQLLPWLERDAERIPQPPGSQAPPRTLAIRRELYLAPLLFSPPYLDSDSDVTL